jgi:hypothetical protein
MSSTRDRLLIVANRYAELSGLSLATISTRACNDGKVLPRLVEGRDVNTRTFDNAMAWFSGKWGEDWEGPAGIERPPAAASQDAAA